MEEQRNFKARDGKTIYYMYNQAGEKPSDRVIILGHGLTGHPYEYLHQIAYRHFNAQGYDTIRIAYYGEEKDARNLSECTIKTHADDLNNLIASIRGEYQKVFYCGHSYGGITALLANPDINATAFWDSTYIPDFWDDFSTYLPELDCYRLDWGVEALTSKAMYEEAKKLTKDVMKEYAYQYKNPSIVCIAGANTAMSECRRGLFRDLPDPKKETTIDGATHCFFEKDTATELAQETLTWFEKY